MARFWTRWTSRAPTPEKPAVPEKEEEALARESLVEGIARIRPWSGSAWDPRVLEAMGRVSRRAFAPSLTLEDAYADEARGIGHGQTISQPTMVALMTQALELSGKERVLEIGTGSGYQTAVLSELASEVDTIERIPELFASARASLGELPHVRVHLGDGHRGLPERAPFDRILLTAAPPLLPRALLDQLAEDGLLVAPVGEVGSDQRLLRLRRSNGVDFTEDLGGVRFVPMC